LELIIASFSSGIISYFITKFYDTQNALYVIGLMIMVLVIAAFVFAFNKIRPDE
jgi:phosphotransferase system  glucose/maltose/N-acetylglucosamine-specific IIC component